MGFKEQFKVGDIVKISLSRDSNDFFITKIIYINYEKNSFLIHSINKIIPIDSIILVKKEFGDIVFIFSTKILSYTNEIFQNIIELSIPKKINKIPRKEFYHLPLNIEVSLKNSVDEPFSGESININSLGISLELDKKLYQNENVKITIPFSKDFILKDIDGLVKRIDTGNKFHYRYNINFDYTNSPVKEDIVSYIFKVQKMLLQISNNM